MFVMLNEIDIKSVLDCYFNYAVVFVCRLVYSLRFTFQTGGTFSAEWSGANKLNGFFLGTLLMLNWTVNHHALVRHCDENILTPEASKANFLHR